jgi:hypothetical protein
MNRIVVLVIGLSLAVFSRAIAEEPAAKELVKAGEFVRIYDPSVGEKEKWYINDHCFASGDDGQWHLFGITHAEPANPMDEKHAAEVVRDRDGKWYISRCGWGEGGVYLAPLVWNDGLDDKPTNIPVPIATQNK